MSEKMWDVTLKHARDCVLGSKLYIYGGSSYTIILNPICEIVKVVVNGQTYSKQYLSSLNSVRISLIFNLNLLFFKIFGVNLSLMTYLK